MQYRVLNLSLMGLDIIIESTAGERSPVFEGRLGNVAEVRSLQIEVSRFIDPNESILLQKVLYSGSHSGDAIPVSDFFKLKVEFSSLRSRQLSPSPELRRFLDVIEQAVDVGIRENQPIQFA